MDKKTKIIAIMGAAATGKDTIKNILLRERRLNSVISYTTRPRRPNESNGIDYHFIDDKKMDKIIPNALESTTYIVNGVRQRYCLTKELFSDKIDNVVVINPIGLKQIVAKYPEIKERLLVVYLKLYKEIACERYLEREKDSDDQKALVKRLIARQKRDQIDFEDFTTFINKEGIKKLEYFNYSSVDTANSILKVLEHFSENLVGKRIRIISMEDEPKYNGKTGIVESVDSFGNIHGTWGGLAIVPSADEFEVLK